MGAVKFWYGKYGIDNSKKASQSIVVRIFHSSLDYRRSLKVDISREAWDFKKNHITDLNKVGNRTYEETTSLNLIREELEKIETVFKRELLNLKLSRKLKHFNKQDWIEWSDGVVTKARGGEITDKALLKDKMQEYREYLVSSGSPESTIKSWATRIRLLESLEKDRKHKFYTYELDLKFWQMSMDWMIARGNKPSYHGEFIKKIKATYNHFKPLNSDSAEWNEEVANKKFRVTRSKADEDNFIPLAEWKEFHNYNGKGYLNNMRDLAIIQYDACLRYSELFEQLTYFENNGKIKGLTSKGGKYYWKIREQKTSNREKDTFKEIPVTKRIVSMIENKTLPHIISATKANKYIKELANEVGAANPFDITTHTLRHSRITHLTKEGLPTRDIKMLSGHRSDTAFQGYNHDKGDLNSHSIPLD